MFSIRNWRISLLLRFPSALLIKSPIVLYSLFDDNDEYYEDDEYYDDYEYDYEEEEDEEECVWQGGQIGSFGNSSERFWTDLEKRSEPLVIEDLLREIRVWNFSAEVWEDLLNYNSTSISRSVWPFSSKEVILCNTVSSPLLSQSGTIIKIKPVTTEKNENLKLFYFNSPGQFLVPVFKQELFVLEPRDYLLSNKFFQLNLEHVSTLSTEINPCNMEGIKFDSCVRSNALNKPLELSGCLPPFLDTPGVLMEDTKWCSNSSEGQDAFKNYV